MRALVVTLPGDIHALAIAWGLKKKGHTVDRIFPLDLCDGAHWSFEPSANSLRISYAGSQTELLLSEVDVVWLRRVPETFPMSHIEDIQERAASETELGHLTTAIFESLSPSHFCVNPLQSSIRAGKKLLQLRVASCAGLTVPRTVISNNPEEILSFHQDVHSNMVYKPLRAFLWERDDKNRSIAATTVVTDTQALIAANVQASPAIYQELLNKCAEVRVTVLGRSFFAWLTRPKSSSSNWPVDWRFAKTVTMTHEQYSVPEALREQCLQVMDQLGLVFGCFDFALLDDGSHVFLEVNPGGQFLWGDELGVGINQLDAFISFLENRDPNFEYSAPRNALSFSQFLAECDFQRELDMEISAHYGRLDRFHFGRVSVKF